MSVAIGRYWGGTRMADFSARRESFIALMNENGYVR